MWVLYALNHPKQVHFNDVLSKCIYYSSISTSPIYVLVYCAWITNTDRSGLCQL